MTKRIPRIGGRRVAPIDINSRAPNLPRFTVATLPRAGPRTAQQIFVADGALSKRIAMSDGTAWRFLDETAVS